MMGWPISAQADEDCSTVKDIVDGAMPILSALYDLDACRWCFMTNEEILPMECMEVPLKDIVERDPSLLHLADLPPGWIATRESLRSPWIYEAPVATNADRSGNEAVARREIVTNKPTFVRLIAAVAVALIFGVALHQLNYAWRTIALVSAAAFCVVGFALLLAIAKPDD